MALRRERKVLLISGHTEDVAAHRGVLKPGARYLAKPFTAEGLAAKNRQIPG